MQIVAFGVPIEWALTSRIKTHRQIPRPNCKRAVGKRGWTVRLSVLSAAIICAVVSVRSFREDPGKTIYETPGLHGGVYFWFWPFWGVVLMGAAIVLFIGAVSIWPRRRKTTITPRRV